MSDYRFIGAAVGNCAGILGCQEAPAIIKNKLNLNAHWYKTIEFKGQARRFAALDSIANFSIELARTTGELVRQNQTFITIGGDHSCAIGTWSGVFDAIGDFGLIWIDAHMDAHTPESSESGNIHGMPVATLLGYGHEKLTRILHNTPKLKAENIILIGIRSYEEGEAELLKELGVTIFDIDAVHKLGFEACFDHAVNQFKAKSLKYGISFDLDGLDPSEIDALGTPVEDGIALFEVLPCLNKIDVKDLVGLELTEYNPSLDSDDKGVEVIRKILYNLPQASLQLNSDYCDEITD
ncbi:MAG: arginase [Francisellaceae bacterium]